MESYVHSIRGASASVSRPGSADGLMPYIACNWPRVIIHAITVGEAAPATSFDAIRVRISLGALRPSDVRVSVVPLDRPAAEGAPIRLFANAERCGDGSYVFEGVVAAAVLTRGTCAIRVTPAQELPGWSYILTPIERRVPCEHPGPRTQMSHTPVTSLTLTRPASLPMTRSASPRGGCAR